MTSTPDQWDQFLNSLSRPWSSLAEDAEQVRQYREEDRRNGIIWADEREHVLEKMHCCTPPRLVPIEVISPDGPDGYVLVPGEGL